MKISASARHQQRRFARVVRRIELRLRSGKQRANNLCLIVADSLMQRRVALGIAHRVVRTAQTCHRLAQSVHRGVIQRPVSRPVGDLGIGPAVDQPQRGIRTVILQEPHQRRATLVVNSIGIGPGIDEPGKDLTVSLSGCGVQGRPAPVVGQRGIGSPVEQQHGQIAEPLAADVVERRVAFGIAPVKVDASAFDEDPDDIFLPVATGV